MIEQELLQCNHVNHLNHVNLAQLIYALHCCYANWKFGGYYPARD